MYALHLCSVMEDCSPLLQLNVLTRLSVLNDLLMAIGICTDFLSDTSFTIAGACGSQPQYTRHGIKSANPSIL